MEVENNPLNFGIKIEQVKFWEYGAEKNESGAAQLTLSVAKAISMEDDVLAVSFRS